MKFILHLSRLWIAVMVALFAFCAIGCEQFQALTYENQTKLPVKATIYRVSLEYTDIPKRTWKDSGSVISTGESKTLLEDVPPTRNGGIGYKYIVVAVSEANEINFSKTYTWDELHNANWIVIITTQ